MKSIIMSKAEADAMPLEEYRAIVQNEIDKHRDSVTSDPELAAYVQRLEDALRDRTQHQKA